MKLKEIKFIELYVDEAPKSDNQWRGIVAEIGGIHIARINYWDDDEDFTISGTFIENTLSPSCDETIEIFNRRDSLTGEIIKYKTKEEAKDAVREGVKRYFEFFIEDTDDVVIHPDHSKIWGTN